MAQKLKNLKIKEISAVTMGANPGAFVLFTKAMSPFGEFVLRRMASKGLTRGDVAAKMRVTRGTFNRYMTGAVIRPPTDRMKILAQVLGVDIKTLLSKIPEERRLPEPQVHGKPVGKKSGDTTMTDKMNDELPMEDEKKEEEEKKTEKCNDEEEMAKALDVTVLQKHVADLEKQLLALHEEKETAKWVEKAAPLSAVAKEAGPVLRRIASFDPDLAEGVFKMLMQMDAVAKEAGLFKEHGTAGIPSGDTAYSRLNAKADELRKSEPKLTKQQAFAKAWDMNPDLVAEYKKEEI